MAYTLIFLHLQKLRTFFSKNTCELDSVLTRTVNILTTNEVVKQKVVWTTGPCFVSKVLSWYPSYLALSQALHFHYLIREMKNNLGFKHSKTDLCNKTIYAIKWIDRSNTYIYTYALTLARTHARAHTRTHTHTYCTSLYFTVFTIYDGEQKWGWGCYRLSKVIRTNENI